MALIEGRDLWKGLLAKSYLSKDRLLWSLLFEAVQAKYKVVKKDPYEKKGVRQVLNLGHTMGHFYEGHFGLSHGEAVGQGLVFALKWSQKKGYLSRHHFQLLETLRQMGVDKKKYKKVSVKTLEKYLKQDKKVSGQGEVRFVFVERPGKAPVVEVTIKSLIQEARRQGLVL